MTPNSERASKSRLPVCGCGCPVAILAASRVPMKNAASPAARCNSRHTAASIRQPFEASGASGISGSAPCRARSSACARVSLESAITRTLRNAPRKHARVAFGKFTASGIRMGDEANVLAGEVGSSAFVNGKTRAEQTHDAKVAPNCFTHRVGGEQIRAAFAHNDRLALFCAQDAHRPAIHAQARGSR